MARRKKAGAALKVVPSEALRIDLGCGKNKREGFLGVDTIDFDGVDVVLDIGKDRWPWDDDSVEEAHASHVVEHLKPGERIHFVNELHRVLKPGGKATIIVPHWCASRAYGDLTHQWPPVVEFWFYYLNAEWRATNAPHNREYTCDFSATWGYSLHPSMTLGRSQDAIQFMTQAYKEVCQDLQASITKNARKNGK